MSPSFLCLDIIRLHPGIGQLPTQPRPELASYRDVRKASTVHPVRTDGDSQWDVSPLLRPRITTLPSFSLHASQLLDSAVKQQPHGPHLRRSAVWPLIVREWHRIPRRSFVNTAKPVSHGLCPIRWAVILVIPMPNMSPSSLQSAKYHDFISGMLVLHIESIRILLNRAMRGS